MYLNSMFPSPPPVPATNAHHIFFKRPDQAEWPNFTMHIDLGTLSDNGLPKRVMYNDYIRNIDDMSTGLSAAVEDGGLGLQGWNAGVTVRDVRRDGGKELIGIMGENSSEYITLIHSCLRSTIPFAPISPFSTPFELTHALTLSKVTRLFVDEKLHALVLPVANKVGLSHSRIHILKGSEAKSKRAIPEQGSFWGIIENVRKRGTQTIPIQPATSDTLAYLVFSSGTSGLPKAVMISHGNLIYAMGQAFTLFEATLEVYTPPVPQTPDGLPVTLAFLPLHHSYGLHAYSFRCTFVPSTLVILPKWNVEVALNAISRYKVSALTLIPSLIHQLVHHPSIGKADLRSVSSVLCGAAYLPPELGAKFLRHIPNTVRFTEGYGMSEATIGAVMQPVDGMLDGKLKHLEGSAGVLLPGMEARLLKHEHAVPPSSTTPSAEVDCGVNEEGELWLRSQNIALGYWNNPKANSETFVRGWLKTGDRFRVDENGNFWFADRTKDTLKISGSQVSPVEIENCLLSHPEGLISDATVAGVSGGRTDDEKVPRAWIVLSATGKDTKKGWGKDKVIKELDRWHKENLSKYKWLRGGIEVVDEIPKSPTGKVLRRILQERHEGRVKKSKGWFNRRAKL